MMDFNSFVTNIKLDSTSKPQLTVDEVEKIERMRVANIIGHVFQLTYAAIFDSLIQEEKVRRCNGCDIHHPSQREHSCLMMDSEDGQFYYHDDVREKIDLNQLLKTAESVCGALGFKLGKSWKAYVTELPKLPWTNIYLTSILLYTLYYGPCGLKCRDVKATEAREEVKNIDPIEIKCPENVVRKEELMDLDYVVNEIQNKFYV